MSKAKPPCDCCGSPAIVHITSDMGQGLYARHLCLQCADLEAAALAKEARGLNHSAVLLAVGLLVLVISAGADGFRFGLAEGFGYWQWIGVLLGGLLILMGAVARVSTIGAIGFMTVGLTILADWLRFGADPGFGAKQIIGCLVGIILIGAGLILSRRKA